MQVRGLGMDDNVSHTLLQINHYMVKSRAEYEKKKLRGNANRNRSDIDKYDRFDEKYWNSFDINDKEDSCILRFLDATKAEMNNIRSMLC